MTNIWAEISELGDLLTILAVAPFMIAMGFIALSAGIFGAEPEMITKVVDLMVRGILALVPLSLGGILLAMLFKFAEERA